MRVSFLVVGNLIVSADTQGKLLLYLSGNSHMVCVGGWHIQVNIYVVLTYDQVLYIYIYICYLPQQHIRLLFGCGGLEQDASCFWVRSTGFTPAASCVMPLWRIVRISLPSAPPSLSRGNACCVMHLPPWLHTRLTTFHAQRNLPFVILGTWYNDLTALCLPNWNL